MPQTPQLSPDKLPPQNTEAEKCLLGSILIDRESLDKIADSIESKDFYNRTNQMVYGAMANLYEKREPIDIMTLTNRLEETNELESIGGVAYLTDLLSTVPTSAHILNYAKIVKRKKILRDLIDASHHIIGLGYQEEVDLENILDMAEQRLFSVSQQSIQQNFSHIKQSLEEAFERLDKLHKGDGILRGLPSGFYDLDSLLAGFQKSDLIILGARPSLGKTGFVLDIARNIAKKEKIPVGIFSLEMSKEQVIDRFIAAEASVGLWKLRTGKLSHEGDQNDFSKIGVALESLSDIPIFIDDTPSPTILQMRAMARRLQAEHKLGMIIIDYLQLIKPTNYIDSMVQQVTEISRSLKSLAKELNIPILAVSQLNRAVDSRSDQRPKLSDLRESGSLEQDADVVLLIYREDKVKNNSDRPNVAEIIIAKHRNGPTGSVELFFDEEEASFRSYAKNL